MTELTAARGIGFRPHPLLPDAMLTTTFFDFEVTIPAEFWVAIKDLKDLPASPHRTLRLDLGIMLNQNDGTFPQTNQIAAYLAYVTNRNQKQEYKRLLDKLLEDIKETVNAMPSQKVWDLEQATQVIELAKARVVALP